MDTDAEPPAQALAVAEDLLKNVDLDRLGTYATAAAATIVLVRRHPWLLIAAGATVAAMGAWQLSRKSRGDPKEDKIGVRATDDSANGSSGDR